MALDKQDVIPTPEKNPLKKVWTNISLPKAVFAALLGAITVAPMAGYIQLERMRRDLQDTHRLLKNAGRTDPERRTEIENYNREAASFNAWVSYIPESVRKESVSPVPLIGEYTF